MPRWFKETLFLQHTSQFEDFEIIYILFLISDILQKYYHFFQDCPDGSKDFRSEQCAEYNDKEFEDIKYE